MQSLCLDMKLLREDGTEVEIKESVDYTPNPNSMKMLENGESGYSESQENFSAKGYQVGTSNEEGEFVAEEPTDEMIFEEMTFEEDDNYGDE